MTLSALPFLDLAVGLLAAGALLTGRRADPLRTIRVAFAVAGGATGLATLASAAYFAGATPAGVLRVDELTALLVPLVSLMHLLTVLGTARTKLRRLSFPRMLGAEAVRLAVFGWPGGGPAGDGVWGFVGLVVLADAFPVWELVARRQTARLYLLHLVPFAACLAGGEWLLTGGGDRTAGAVLVAVAVAIRCGVVPAHGWVSDLCERASFGTALLAFSPGVGLLVAARLLVPVVPEAAGDGVELLAVVTAVLAAAVAVVQRSARRLFACLAVSYSALALTGILSGTTAGVTAGYAVWAAALVSLGGVGLTLRAVEARIGRLDLTRYHGLYDLTPELAVGYLVCALAGVGFPGTVGFVAGELVAEAAVEDGSALVLAAVLAASALNSIAVMRAYYLVFTGTTHPAAVPLAATRRERATVLILAALVLGFGLVPQPWVGTRARAAVAACGGR